MNDCQSSWLARSLKIACDLLLLLIFFIDLVKRTHHSQPLWMWSLPSLPHHEDTTRCDHQRKQAELSRREQPHPTSRSRRTTATHHRGLFGSSLAMGVLSICTTENDPVKYNLNVGHVSADLLYSRVEQTWRSESLVVAFAFCVRWWVIDTSTNERTQKEKDRVDRSKACVGSKKNKRNALSCSCASDLMIRKRTLRAYYQDRVIIVGLRAFYSLGK